jgi:hypothetical protein
VTVDTAIKKLELKGTGSIYNSQKYRKFLIKGQRHSENRFDLQGYIKREDNLSYIQSYLGLFIEYVYHIENVSYTNIAKEAGSHIQIIQAHQYSAFVAIDLFNTLLKNKEHWIDAWLDYYDEPKSKFIKILKSLNE